MLREIRFLLRVSLDIFLQLGDLALDVPQLSRALLVLVLGDVELLAEELEGEVFVAHVELVYLLLYCYLSFEFEVHIYLHRFKLILILLLRLLLLRHLQIIIIVNSWFLDSLCELVPQVDDLLPQLVDDLRVVRYVELHVQHVPLHHRLYLLRPIRILQRVQRVLIRRKRRRNIGDHDGAAVATE